MATAVEALAMPREFHQSRESSLMSAVFASEGATQLSSSDPVDLPRAASYNDFTTLTEVHFDAASHEGARDSSSIDDQHTESISTDNVSPSSSGNTTPDSESTASLKMNRSQAEHLRQELPKLATSETVLSRGAVTEHPLTTPVIKTPVSAGSDDLSELPTSAAPSLSARFRRRSWMPGSRSPSPAKHRPSAEGIADTFGRAVRRSSPFRRSANADDKNTTRSRSTSLSRRVSSKLQKRPSSITVEDLTRQSGPPPSFLRPAQLSKSFSTEKLSLSGFGKTKLGSAVQPIPRLAAKEKQRPARPEPAKKRDELWTAFRNLDAEYQKFEVKPAALKANVVRAVLLPFIREYHGHPSTYRLRLEDLERRAHILNKWWGGLLELICNTSNQAVSGTDRPAILDAILGIMERPEWRLAPSPFCPLDERNRWNTENASTSTSSLGSDSSELLGDSVNHNVRNIFTQNLIKQMGFVVEKMSLRSAPASVVSFCGRTCAFAFFFCPGIADVLIRLWNPTMDMLNRVLQECGHKRSVNLNDIAQAIGSGFPPHLSSIKFTNISATYRALRRPAPLPLRTHGLPWSSPSWVNRWCGKESDLFYVFVKHFHLLVVDFLPHTTTKTERLCAPGLIFVHAQMLTNIDATIRRNSAPKDEDPRQGASNSTFDDILHDPDSAAPTLPLPPTTNAARQMAENRVIMLVRDFLSERSTNPDQVQQIFAQAFSDLLKAGARRTSIYDPNACYILCDLVEEAFLILVRYEHLTPDVGAVLDWPFWMDVWKRIVDSHNTTTEIRLYALLYSLWPALVIEPTRKLELCSSFLLEPSFFQSRFNHWCPMVRAYFMRLLCWRVARFDGDEQSGDVAVLERLSDALQSQYAHYVHLRDAAHNSPALVPSTAPCNPAPGRRLLIVRTDPIVSQARGIFMSFDGVLSPHPNMKKTPALGSFSPSDLRPVSNSSTDSEPDLEDKGTKKWGLLRTIIGTSKQERTKSQSPSTSSLVPKESTAKTATTLKDTRQSAQSKDTEVQNQESETSHFKSFSFKFSLEWADRLDRRLQTPGPMRILPPRLPLPAQALLQSTRSESVSSGSPIDSHLTVSGPSGAFRMDLTTGQGRDVETAGLEPVGEARCSAKYSGRALAEWALVVGECGSFFDRRRGEGVPGNRSVETPSLGVESFKRPG